MPGAGATASGGAALRRIGAAAAVTAALLPAAAFSQGKQPGAGQGEAGQKQERQQAGAGAGKQKGKPEETGPPQLRARAWVLVDPRDDAVLASSASGRRLAIASATKLMTALVALEELRPKQTLRAPAYQALAAESLLGLRAGEKMTVRDLLYALVLASANDAAATLAEGTSGSVARFVRRMNREARALGLDDTSFANPIGLDDPDNYSSAADLAALATVLLEDPLFARIADSETAVLRSGDRTRRISSRNTLLGLDESADGVKTGRTQQAGYVLVGSATRDGTRLVSAVLGAGSEAARDVETKRLLDYGFSLYEPERPVERGQELADPDLDYRDETLPLRARRTVVVSSREGQAVRTRVEAPEELSGDIAEGQRLGRVIVTVDGRAAGSTPLVASRSVEAATLADKTLSVAQNPVILLPAGAFVIFVGLLLAARGRRSGPDDEIEAPTEPRPEPRRERRKRGPRERTSEERRQMQEERMRRRRRRNGEEEGPG